MKIIGIGITALILFFLQRVLYLKLWKRDLKVTVSFAQAGITEGEKSEIIEVIENRKHLPLPMLKVKFQTSKNLKFGDDIGSKTTDQYYRNDIFQVGSGEKITRKIAFTGEKRGYYHIKNIDLVGSDLFLTNEDITSMSTNCYLYVYPAVFKSREFQSALQKINGDVLVKRHLLEDPFEYRGIREYQPFDDMRSVNWKATARTDGLKVNQRNYTAMQTIRIFLNLEDDMQWRKYKEVEKAIQIVMGIAVNFLSQGIKVALYANGKDILTEEHIEIEGGAGISQLDTMKKALARIDTAKEVYPFTELFERKVKEKGEGYFNIFVSPNGYEPFVSLLSECDREKIEYTWFYPVLLSQKEEVQKQISNGRILKHVQFVTMD